MSGEPETPTVETLVKHAAFIRGVCRAMLRDEHLAEDAAQETFAAALTRSGGTLRRPVAWLGAVARNLSRRAIRTRARREARELAVARRDGVPSAAANAARLETERRVVAAVAALPEPARAVVILRYFDGVGPTEIARRQGLPVRTVESRLRRALATLRERLLAEAGPDRDRDRARLLVLAGATIMTTKTKLLAAAAAVLLLTGGAVLLARPPNPPPAPTPAAPVARTQAPPPPGELPVVPAIPEAAPAHGDRPIRPDFAKSFPRFPPPGTEGTGAAHGTIRYEDGAPVSGAALFLAGPRSPLPGKTDAGGAWRFEEVPVPAEGAWSLRLGTREASVDLGPVALRADADEETNLVIRRGRPFRIRVRSALGRSVGGVPVRLRPGEGNEGSPADGTAAPDGTLSFDHLVPGEYTVEVPAWHPHGAWRGSVDTAIWSSDVPFVIELCAPQELVVRVKGWSSGPGEKIRVMLAPLTEGAGTSYTQGEIDGDGVFRGTAPPAGDYRVTIWLAGRASLVPRLKVPARASAEIEIAAPEGVEVAGRLLTSSGEPVPGAGISLTPTPPTAVHPRGGTSASGEFGIRFVPPGRYLVSAEVGELVYLDLDPASVDVGEGGRSGLSFRLPERGTGSVAGRLAGFATAPVPGDLRQILIHREGPTGWGVYASATVGSGEFRIDGLPPGRYRFEVSPLPIAGLEGSGAATFELAAGEEKSGVTIRAEVRPEIRFALRRPDGKPFRSRVTAFATRVATDESVLLVLEPDEEGIARSSALAPGDWRLNFVGGPERLTAREIEVPERPGRPVELVLW